MFVPWWLFYSTVTFHHHLGYTDCSSDIPMCYVYKWHYKQYEVILCVMYYNIMSNFTSYNVTVTIIAMYICIISSHIICTGIVSYLCGTTKWLATWPMFAVKLMVCSCWYSVHRLYSTASMYIAKWILLCYCKSLRNIFEEELTSTCNWCSVFEGWNFLFRV